jgi:hypothetical protein
LYNRAVKIQQRLLPMQRPLPQHSSFLWRSAGPTQHIAVNHVRRGTEQH